MTSDVVSALASVMHDVMICIDLYGVVIQRFLRFSGCMAAWCPLLSSGPSRAFAAGETIPSLSMLGTRASVLPSIVGTTPVHHRAAVRVLTRGNGGQEHRPIPRREQPETEPAWTSQEIVQIVIKLNELTNCNCSSLISRLSCWSVFGPVRFIWWTAKQKSIEKRSMSAASKSNHVGCDHRVWRSFAHPTLERAPGAQATEKPSQSTKHQPPSVVGATIQPLDHAFDRETKPCATFGARWHFWRCFVMYDSTTLQTCKQDQTRMMQTRAGGAETVSACDSLWCQRNTLFLVSSRAFILVSSFRFGWLYPHFVGIFFLSPVFFFSEIHFKCLSQMTPLPRCPPSRPCESESPSLSKPQGLFASTHLNSLPLLSVRSVCSLSALCPLWSELSLSSLLRSEVFFQGPGLLGRSVSQRRFVFMSNYVFMWSSQVFLRSYQWTASCCLLEKCLAQALFPPDFILLTWNNFSREQSRILCRLSDLYMAYNMYNINNIYIYHI